MHRAASLSPLLAHPTGTYTDLAYTATTGPGSGYWSTTPTRSSPLPRPTHIAASRLASVAKGNKEAAYTYSTDSSGNQSVQTVEQSAGLLQTRYTRTVDYYGIDGSTTVTRKKNLTYLIVDPADEATTYTFHVDSYTGMKQYVNTVTGPTGTHTTYDIAYFSGPEGGEPYAVTVRDSGANFFQQTNYTYDGNTGAVLGVEAVDSSGNPLSMDSSAYYTNSAGLTVWLESHEQTRESWTHYIRDPNNMANVLAVQTAGPGLDSEPQWVDSGANYLIAPIKDYTYYTPTDSAGGLPGQVKTETVPGVGWIGGNQVAYVDSTGYVYVDSAGYHNSPTQTTYHYTDGGAKTNTTAYDALDRVLSATDAKAGPSVTPMTPSAARFLPVITTASARKTRILLHPPVEHGRKRPQDLLRLRRRQSRDRHVYRHPRSVRAHPLVAYTYDLFGNRQTVTTCSGVRETPSAADDLHVPCKQSSHENRLSG